MERAYAQMKIKEIKTSAEARDAFIEAHKPFILKVASQSSKRVLNWENDEALSIALLAFNEAIEQYNSETGAFLGFARLVIQRRLIDYFRKEARHLHLQLEDTQGEVIQATAHFNREQLRQEQQQEIAKLTIILKSFNISFKDLVNGSPSHRDTRVNLMAAAEIVCQDEDLLQLILTKHKLPLRNLMQITGLSKKVLKTWRRYFLALIVIGSQEDFNYIRSFIGMKRGHTHV